MNTFYLDKTRVIKEGVNGIMDKYIVMSLVDNEFVCFKGYDISGTKIYDLDKDHFNLVIFDKNIADVFTEYLNKNFENYNVKKRLFVIKAKDVFRYDFSFN